jgi:hypothetical protein
MTARNPIDLTEEEPISALSEAEIEECATIFVDLDAVVLQRNAALKLIDRRDWHNFVNKATRVSAAVIFLTERPIDYDLKHAVRDIGLEQPIFSIANKRAFIKLLLLSNHPLLIIDTNVVMIQQIRKKFPQVNAYWAMTKQKFSVWNVFNIFFELFFA